MGWMRVLIVEDNLIWSSRVQQALLALGHECAQYRPGAIPDCEAAVLGLGFNAEHLPVVIQALQERKIPIIAHCGHAEKQLSQKGRDLGCDHVVTNGSLTLQLQTLLPKTS